MRRHGVQEVTVVAYDQHRVLEIGEPVLEPCHRIEVQVVGGLVEQQVVGISEQGLGQQYAHLLVGAHVLHQHVVAVLLDAEARQQRGGVALGVPALQLGEFLLQLGGLDAVLVAEIRLGVESVLLRHDVPQHGVAAHHGLQNRALVELEVVLTQHRQTLARAEGHRALSCRKLARQYLHQRRFACSVGSDDTVAVAVVERQIDVLKQHALAELHSQIAYLYHLIRCLAFFIVRIICAGFMFEALCITLRISSNCFSKRFTSWSDVPEPRLMRWRRVPLITSGFSRS